MFFVLNVIFQQKFTTFFKSQIWDELLQGGNFAFLNVCTSAFHELM
jgi:hypothetical protein